MGIRGKVIVGFTILALLVAGAGAVSMLELGRIGNETQRIIEENNRNMAFCRELIEGANMVHIALADADLPDAALTETETGIETKTETGAGGSGLFAGSSADSLYNAGRLILAESVINEREQMLFGEYAGELEHIVYRSIMPSLVTLVVVLLLLVLLLYFIDLYYIKPVVAMNKGVKDWLAAGVPFRVSFEGRDETSELGENISELVSRARKNPIEPPVHQ